MKPLLGLGLLVLEPESVTVPLLNGAVATGIGTTVIVDMTTTGDGLDTAAATEVTALALPLSTLSSPEEPTTPDASDAGVALAISV
jgi:hypothetical protein